MPVTNVEHTVDMSYFRSIPFLSLVAQWVASHWVILALILLGWFIAAIVLACLWSLWRRNHKGFYGGDDDE
jgi:hypothetical protein